MAPTDDSRTPYGGRTREVLPQASPGPKHVATVAVRPDRLEPGTSSASRRREQESRSRVHEALWIRDSIPTGPCPGLPAGRPDARRSHPPLAGRDRTAAIGRLRVKAADRQSGHAGPLGRRPLPESRDRGSVKLPSSASTSLRWACTSAPGTAGAASSAGKSVTRTLPDGRSYRFELETNLDEVAELAFSGEL